MKKTENQTNNNPVPVFSPILQESTVNGFVQCVHLGIQSWTRAGEILVKLVESNPNVYSEIISQQPSITFEMLLAFEKMGRKQIYPPLLMDASPAAKTLLTLPYELQERYSKEPIEVVVKCDNGSPITEKKHLKELSVFESRMVFNHDKVQDLEEQVEFFKTHTKQGRKSKIERDDSFVGTFILKMSPSGNLVAEKSKTKLTGSRCIMFKKGETSQCVVNLFTK